MPFGDNRCQKAFLLREGHCGQVLDGRRLMLHFDARGGRHRKLMSRCRARVCAVLRWDAGSRLTSFVSHLAILEGEIVIF
jgi:hypothetical protein